jgi:Phytanoyl-CoA dioxygenase (PhyH)
MAMSVGQRVARDVTDEEVTSYVRDGWVSLPGFMDRDVVAELLAAAKSLMGDSGVESSPRPGLDVDWQNWYDRHFMAREGLEPFRSIAYAPQMGKAVQRFNERDIAIRHYADMIAVKPPAGAVSRARATPIHQDFPNRQFDRVGNVTIWVALEDMPAERGTVRFRTGSHRLGSLGNIFGRDGHDLDIHDVYPWLAKRCPLSEPRDMQAGDATAHHGLMLHSAPQNATDVPRWAYISIYIPADTLWTGAKMHGFSSVEGLAVDQPFDHPYVPVVYP